MLSTECLRELRSAWLPNLTDRGLDRLIELLEKSSPLLVHGCFTKATPMGCLATHAAWHHPRTAHLNQEAGVSWLSHVARLNPATSAVIREWDSCGADAWSLRMELAAVLGAERDARRNQTEAVPEHRERRVRELVQV